MPTPIVLIIEDQKSIADLLKENFLRQTNYEVLVAYNYQQAKEIIESDVNISVCITDLNLPDAEEGATVPLLAKHHITTVVLTGNYTDETRERMYQERVADYVFKDGMSAIQYAVKSVTHLVENSEHNVWILSPLSKHGKRLLGLLNIHRYRVSMFDSADEMLAMLKVKAPDLLILNQVRQLDGFADVKFIQKIRALYSQSQLPVIMSDDEVDSNNMIRLMKYGVNDFYNLNFTIEELYVRLQLHISLVKTYRHIERISQVDSLTGLYNRRYFFEHSELLSITTSHLFAIMLDIDHFKAVNDNYGHDVGDKAIQYVATTIKKTFSDYLVARFGGEEFCVYGIYSELDDVLALCEKVRADIEQNSEQATGVAFTISQGLAKDLRSVDKLLSQADKALYQSKESGRNQVTLFAAESA